MTGSHGLQEAVLWAALTGEGNLRKLSEAKPLPQESPEFENRGLTPNLPCSAENVQIGTALCVLWEQVAAVPSPSCPPACHCPMAGEHRATGTLQLPSFPPFGRESQQCDEGNSHLPRNEFHYAPAYCFVFLSNVLISFYLVVEFS